MTKRNEYVNGYNSQEAIPLMDNPNPEIAQQAFLRYKAARILGSDFINYFAENLSMPKGGIEEFSKAFPQSTFHNQVLMGLRNSTGENPTLKLARIVDELYSNTRFSTMHGLAKEGWESSSSTGEASWFLQESVGTQFNGDVQYFWAGVGEEAMDKAAEDAKGLFNRKWHEDELGAQPTQEDWDEYVKVHKALSRWMLDVAFPDTDTLTVYRGTSFKEVVEEDRKGIVIGEKVLLQSNPLTSWSLKPEVGFKFAVNEANKPWLLEPAYYEPFQDEMRPNTAPASSFDRWLGEGWENQRAGPKNKANDVIVLKTEIPKDDIFSHFGSYAYHGNENEIIGIHSPDREVQIWDYRDTALQMAEELTPTPDFLLTQGAVEEKLPENIQTYNWKDWAREWGREASSVHPRLWEELDNDGKLSIDPEAEIEEEEQSPLRASERREDADEDMGLAERLKQSRVKTLTASEAEDFWTPERIRDLAEKAGI